jgi:hypothetical protein
MRMNSTAKLRSAGGGVGGGGVFWIVMSLKRWMYTALLNPLVIN